MCVCVCFDRDCSYLQQADSGVMTEAECCGNKFPLAPYRKKPSGIYQLFVFSTRELVLNELVMYGHCASKVNNKNACLASHPARGIHLMWLHPVTQTVQQNAQQQEQVAGFFLYPFRLEYLNLSLKIF